MFKVLQRATNTFNTSDSSVNRLSKNIFSALHMWRKGILSAVPSVAVGTC